MVRFKNRYMVFELVWKDGKVDDTISERLAQRWAGLGAQPLSPAIPRICAL